MLVWPMAFAVGAVRCWRCHEPIGPTDDVATVTEGNVLRVRHADCPVRYPYAVK